MLIPKDRDVVDVLRPKQCPNCQERNKPDSKFCAKCRMVLTYDAYNETLENQKEKDDKIGSMENTINTMQSQIQSLISAFSNMHEHPQVDSMAKTLYSSGDLVKAAADNNNDNANEERLQLIKAAGQNQHLQEKEK
jgi:hypothetical protein